MLLRREWKRNTRLLLVPVVDDDHELLETLLQRSEGRRRPRLRCAERGEVGLHRGVFDVEVARDDDVSEGMD